MRLWDDELGKPATHFLGMPVCNIGTAAKLFDTTLEERAIPWSNVVAFESDTTNVMVGNITLSSHESRKSSLMFTAKVMMSPSQPGSVGRS